MDITQASFSFSSLTGSYAQAAAHEPAGAGFASMMSHCAGKGCDTAKSASFSASVMNIDITSFSIEDETRSYDPLREFIDALFDHITGADKNGSKDNAGQDSYSFTSDFQSIFGNTGPLIDFINATTSKLGLSEEKNLALQQIAINNKDATRSRESIDKIGAELKAAGIYA